MTTTSSSRRIFTAMLEHLRREGDDLHEVALAQLAGHGAEDARAAGVVLGIDDDDGLDDLALADGPLRVGRLDRGSDHVADARVAPARAALDANAEDLAGPGVVGDLQARLVLDHFARSRISTRRQRLVRLMGRASTTRTRSPSLASLRSSWACSVVEERTIFW